MAADDHGPLEARLLAAFGAHVRNALAVARIQGWRFTDTAELGLTLREVTDAAVTCTLRLDDVTQPATIRFGVSIADLGAAVNRLTKAWLKTHATGVPARRRRLR